MRVKFNGRLVSDCTGLDGKELGVFIQRFQRAFPRSRLLSLSASEIENAGRQFPVREDDAP